MTTTPHSSRSMRRELATVAAILLALALVVATYASLMPATTGTTRPIKYSQVAEFGYSAKTPASSVYGSDGLTSGNPIITSVVDDVRFTFTYRLKSTAPSSVHGTHRLVAQLDLGNGLVRTIPLTQGERFRGTSFTQSGILHTADVRKIVSTMHKAGGDTAVATVSIVPTVKLSGTVAGAAITDTFSPTLKFALTGNVLSLVAGPTSSAPGSDSAQGVTDRLHQSKAGSAQVTEQVANVLPIPGLHPTVAHARIVGWTALAVLLLLELWLLRPFLTRADDENSPDRVELLYGSHIVHVQSLTLPDGPIVDMTAMSDLADLAKRYESMMLHLGADDGDQYLLLDGGVLYRYRPAAAERAPVGETAKGPAVRCSGTPSTPSTQPG